jgi:uncharacterized protein YjbI with pentapeptide repeats
VDSSVVGYDGARNVRNEERGVETDSPQPPGPTEKPVEQSSRLQLGLIVLAVLVLGGVVEVIIYGYLERPGWIGVSGKKFWDYLDLLIVPGALALGVYWLNRRQDERDQQAEEDRSRQQLEVENERAQDAAAQAYLDQLTQLLVTQRDQDLIRMRVGDEVREVIQARSEALLRSLTPTRRWSLILFLSVMGLLTKERPLVSLAWADLSGIDGRDAPLQGVDLNGARLSEADLSRADLRNAILTYATLNNANLSGAKLRNADLRNADLSRANLSRANLSEANVRYTNLNYANLSKAILQRTYIRHANLSRADLSQSLLRGADLSRADLSHANLREADLSHADLRETNMSNAEISDKQLSTSGFLEGATMPNGQKYEDWLKDKEGRREDGQNTGSP